MLSSFGGGVVKKYFGTVAIYGVFDFSMLACLPGMGVGSKSYLAKKVY